MKGDHKDPLTGRRGIPLLTMHHFYLLLFSKAQAQKYTHIYVVQTYSDYSHFNNVAKLGIFGKFYNPRKKEFLSSLSDVNAVFC